MSHIISIFLIVLSFHSTLTIAKKSNHSKIPKTYIIKIQNELKPSNISNIKDWYKSILGNIINSSNSSNNNEFLHIYTNVFHGFSIQLTPQQLKSIKNKPEIVTIFRDEIYELHTTRTPHFLGLDSYHNPIGLLKESDLGSNVVVGVLDTGIWPKSRSFDDDGLDIVPTHFKGQCVGGDDFPTTFCNKKIVGVRYFSAGMRAVDKMVYVEDDSVLDTYGHGTHTASTIAGRTLNESVSFFEFAKGEPTGIAPKARLSIYKVCWNHGCMTSDVLSGFDKAVEDGVDIVSISLGGPSRRYSEDPISIATFAAVEKGVFVSASAGNSGPLPGRVSNNAPWITTVGASTIDRTFPAILKLVNGESFVGASLYTGSPLPKQAIYPIVHFPMNWTTSHCMPDSLDQKIVTGKMVVCLPGMFNEVEKSLFVRKAGGVGIVMINDVTQHNDTLTSRPYIIPGLTITFDTSTKLLSYINKTQTNGTIIIQGTQIGSNPAPIVAEFSSRGPNSQSIYVLKPDVIAPGVDILAAWPSNLSPSRLTEDPRRTDYNILSGTSMSCPHVSGVAALLKGSHPDWTPAMIRSALMTTAYKGYREPKPLLEQEYENNVSPWDIGAGHIDPERANDPGLVYDITTNDYIRFLCASNYTENEVKAIAKRAFSCKNVTSKPWDLNYPAIVVTLNQESVATRSLTNVDTNSSSYVVIVMEPKGVKVTVEPVKLGFETKGMKQSFNVTIKPLKNETSLDHQKVGLIIWMDGKHNVTIPLIMIDENFNK
ncbi:hypothetical protein RND81_04G089400 [Saponaria officinalis]|uniref:Uncharacterized protein n=1 Tax=Saponaria officinalis TaxID=3572 RepID=A0AAW1LKC0_SAPOF